MKITVCSRGKTVIDADPGYQEAPVRSALSNFRCGEAAADFVASTIVDHTDSERSDISHDEYAVVTEDDGTGLWSGWLTGDPEAAPPAEAGSDVGLREALEAQVGLWRHESDPDQDDDGYDRAGRNAIGVCANEIAQILARHGTGQAPDSARDAVDAQTLHDSPGADL